MVINKDYAKWDLAKQKASLEGFARAAMESKYVTQRQRVKRLVKEGWLEVTQQSVLVLAELIRSVLNNAATKYETRK